MVKAQSEWRKAAVKWLEHNYVERPKGKAALHRGSSSSMNQRLREHLKQEEPGGAPNDKDRPTAANPCFKKESGWLQTRLSQVLKRLGIPPPEDKEGKSWTLKALRQNVAMEAAEEATPATSKTAAGRKLQHRPGSRATDAYLLERPACLQGPQLFGRV